MIMRKLLASYRAKHSQLKFVDIAQALIIVLVVGALGAYKINSSKAETIYIRGRVTKNGVGVRDVYIDGCGLNIVSGNIGFGVAVATDSSGYFTITDSRGLSIPFGYCLRVAWTDYLPSTDGRVIHNKSILGSISWPPGTNNHPEKQSYGRYEYQAYGLNCYYAGAISGCNPNGGEQTWDLASDTNFVFNFSTPSPTPTPTPSPTPTPTPTPSPTPAPKPGPSPSTGGSNGGSGSGVSLYSGTTLQDTGSGSGSKPDKSPPTAPKDFKATTNDERKSVVLEWQASTDDRGISGYQIEHSMDKKSWEVIAKNISDTTFEDYGPNFGEQNYYRILAYDASGNKSRYSFAETQAAAFEANVIKDQDSTITSEDGVVEIVVPANSVEHNLFCTLLIPLDTLGAVIPGYRQVQGPYQLTCRDEKNNDINIVKNVEIQTVVHADKINEGRKIEIAYFGQDDEGNWIPLKVDSSDKNARTDNVNLSGHSTFTIMTPIKKASIWLTLLKITIVILALIFGGLMFLRFRLKQKLEGKYQDYLHQSRGF